MKDEHLRDAFSIWEELSSRPDELLAYRSRLKQVMDEEAMVREAQLREEAALEKGLEEGREKGREEGREEGAQKANERTARNLLEMNMDIGAVAKATGLSVEQVQKIKEQIN